MMSKSEQWTDADVRDRLRRHLSRFRLSPEEFSRLWEYLGTLEALYVEDEEDFDILCEKAERLYAVLEMDRQREDRAGSGVAAPSGHQYGERIRDLISDSSVSVLTPSERARHTALAHFRVRQASFDRSVQWFRTEVLGGGILEWDDALSFAASPVLAILSREDLAEHNLSPIDLSLQDVAENREYDADDDKVHWHLSGTIMQSGTKLDIHRQGPSHPPILWCMAMQGDGRYWKTGRGVRESSVLHDLLGVTESLVRRYGWDEVEATLFILMDGMPHTHPLEIQTDYASRQRPVTTIKVEPWISWKTIEKAYKAEQRDVYEVVPGEIRKRNAALFSFATPHMDEDGELPGKGLRRALMDSWNERADEIAGHWDAAGQAWQFTDLKDFNRNLVRAQREVLHLRYPDNMSRYNRWITALTGVGGQDQVPSSDNHLDNQDEKSPE